MRICAIIKNEYPCYVDEWLNHHEKLGKITLYNNGDRLNVVPQHNIEVIPFVGTTVQLDAYNHMCKRHPKDYILFIDLDEFFFSKYDVVQLESECFMHGALAFNWQVYGSSGLKNHTTDSQVEKFQTKLPEQHGLNRHIKTMVKGENVLHFINPHEVKLRKGMYQRKTFEGLTGDVDYTLGVINHYFTRSEEEFKKKINVGRADTTSRRSMKEFYAVDKECV